MKIFVYDTLDGFLNTPVTPKPGVRVLDFTRDPRVKKKWNGYLIDNADFSPQEKERLVDEYVEAVSRIGVGNRFSLFWLCHLISEKNELLPGDLFSRTADFIPFYRAFNLCREQNHSLAVITTDPVIAADIRDFARERGVECETGCSLTGKRLYSTGLRGIIATARTQLRLLKEKRTRALKWKHLAAPLDCTKTYTLLRTWFDQRSPGLISKDQDIYYGQLPGYLKEKGRNLLYYGDVINDRFQKALDETPGELTAPMLMEGAFLKFTDFIKAVIFRLRCKRKVKLPSAVTILESDTAVVFRNFFLQGLNHPSLTTNYFTYLAVKRLLKKVKLDQVVNIFENYSWEKVTTLAVKEHKKKIPVAAFQHAQVALSGVKFFHGKHGVPDKCFPDRLITLGKVTRDFLVNQKHYPPVITVPGCALRHDYADLDAFFARKRHGRVVVNLWTFERSIEMLNFLYSCRALLENYRVMISTHPNHPIEKLKPHLDFEDTSKFEFSTRSLKENFQISDAVIYSGTTVCLDALASGVPVINVEFPDFISPDPLFGFHDFKWTAHDEEGIMAAITEIHALNDDQYAERREKAQQFVTDYFHPVTPFRMKKFLLTPDQ